MEFWIWLSNALGAGSPRVNDIVACFETAEHFYAEKKTGFRHVAFLTAAEKQKLSAASLSDALRLKEKTLDKGYHILTPDQAQYPNRLRNIYAMPAVLYADGELNDIDETVAIALVGARRCSDYGRAVAGELGFGLARMGAVVITGMARGIDAAAHEAALLAAARLLCWAVVWISSIRRNTQPCAGRFPKRVWFFLNFLWMQNRRAFIFLFVTA